MTGLPCLRRGRVGRPLAGLVTAVPAREGGLDEKCEFARADVGPCLSVASSSAVKADGLVNSSASCGLALTSYSANTPQSIHPATSLSFFMDRESEFPHNDTLDKLAGLEDTCNFLHINLFLLP